MVFFTTSAHFEEISHFVSFEERGDVIMDDKLKASSGNVACVAGGFVCVSS